MQKVTKSRLFSLLLALSLLAGLICLPVHAESFSGNGSAESPYLLSDAADLTAFAEIINDGRESEAYAELTQDITLTDSWTPLGKNAMSPFRGNFDGKGHTVTLTVDDPSLSYFGFFGCLEDATVQNLTVRGEIYCSEPYAYIGGIAARARGNVTLKNCTNLAILSSLARGCAGIGGIVGGYDDGIEYRYENIRMRLESCTNSGMILVTGADAKVFAGGLVGSNQNCVQLVQCSNTGEIYAPEVWVGGLLGQAGSQTGDYKPCITDCTSDGTLVGAKDKVGRLYGKGVLTEMSGSGINAYTASSAPTAALLSEAQKYSSVLAVTAETAAGTSLSLLKNGQLADAAFSLSYSQGEKDISHGYLDTAGGILTLAKTNTTDAVVQETATLHLSDSNGQSLRKPITICIYPQEANARTKLMHNIAKTYVGNSNEWVVFDMAVYEALGFGTNTTDSETYKNRIVHTLSGNTPIAQDRAKAEIILASLRVDTMKLTPYQSDTSFSNPEKLLALPLATDHYSAPWILLAEEAGTFTLSDDIRSALIALLAEAQGENGMYFYTWGNESFDDADTTATVIAALSRFYETNPTAEAVIDRAVEALSLAQGENGSYGNINTDAMVIIGLAAIGIHPGKDSRFRKSGGSLADSVLLYQNEAKNGFTPPYASGEYGESARALATEQGFRALIVLEQMEKCSAFQVYTQKVSGGESAFRPANRDAFTATAPGETEDPGNNTSGGGNGGNGEDDGDNSSEKNIQVTFSVVAQSETWLSDRYTVANGSTAKDLIVSALTEAGMRAEGAENGYISSVTKGDTTLSQFDAGKNSGWMYSVNGEAPNVGICDYLLQDGDTVKLYFITDYTKDPSSKHYGSGSLSGFSAPKKETEIESVSVAPIIYLIAEAWSNGNGYLLRTPLGMALFLAKQTGTLPYLDFSELTKK